MTVLHKLNEVLIFFDGESGSWVFALKPQAICRKARSYFQKAEKMAEKPV